jgi:hypothetical protein
MKNIHLIPTEKPSRIASLPCGSLKYSKTKQPFKATLDWKPKNIYITSDGKPEDGDWLLIIDGYETYVHKHKGDNLPTTYWKTIILTTDQDLIADGVQSIDDTFLEWFVKNPSCESVEISYGVLKPFQSTDKGYMIHLPDNEVLEKPKQETLEEASSEYVDSIKNKIDSYCYCDIQEGFQQGSKWQAERMYSEEEVDKLLDTLLHNNMCSVAGDELIKQFKKK